ncbi:MAG: hypothetical protein RIS09_291 [Actinomycetota bacterium]|jgi:uncharacterized membrane protein
MNRVKSTMILVGLAIINWLLSVLFAAIGVVSNLSTIISMLTLVFALLSLLVKQTGITIYGSILVLLFVAEAVTVMLDYAANEGVVAVLKSASSLTLALLTLLWLKKVRESRSTWKENRTYAKTKGDSWTLLDAGIDPTVDSDSEDS